VVSPLINAISGFVQEGAIAALAKAVSTEAMVIRNGQKSWISSQEIVPGDVVLLTSGDKVPFYVKGCGYLLSLKKLWQIIRTQ
jgi:P-type E1-E2 ATPase